MGIEPTCVKFYPHCRSTYIYPSVACCREGRPQDSTSASIAPLITATLLFIKHQRRLKVSCYKPHTDAFAGCFAILLCEVPGCLLRVHVRIGWAKRSSTRLGRVGMHKNDRGSHPRVPFLSLFRYLERKPMRPGFFLGGGEGVGGVPLNPRSGAAQGGRRAYMRSQFSPLGQWLNGNIPKPSR